MFDCPEQIHTSPTRMLLIIMWLLASMLMVYGPPAFIGGNSTAQVPSAIVVVLNDLPLNLICNFSPGEAQPHIFILLSLCKIMLSLIRRGSLTCESDGCAVSTHRLRRVTIFSFEITL